MIILDTNVISELMKRHCSPIVAEWVGKQSTLDLFTTTITQAEILYGIAILPTGKKKDELYERANQMFDQEFAKRILSFDEKSAIAFSQIASYRKQIGCPISQADAQIASICYSINGSLATRNVDDFIGCGVKIINPWETETLEKN